MNKNHELSKRFLAWFAARRRVREWIETQAMVDAEQRQSANREEFVALRAKAYALEWELLNDSSTRSAWNQALSNVMADDPDWALANELRNTRENLGMLSPTSEEGKKGLTVSGWWFIPMATWVGLQSSTDRRDRDHARPQLQFIREAFQKRLSARMPHMLEVEAALTEADVSFALQVTPFLSIEGLRSGPLPPGVFDQWDESQKALFDIPADPENPLRAACLGIYVAASDYPAFATLRDLLREELAQDLEDMSSDTVRFGMMMERVAAVEEAELLQWDLWADEVVDAPLHSGAEMRHIVLTVFRKEGLPQWLEGTFRDTDAQSNTILSGSMECRLGGGDSMFHDALEPFVANQRGDVFWTLHNRNVTTDG